MHKYCLAGRCVIFQMDVLLFSLEDRLSEVSKSTLHLHFSNHRTAFRFHRSISNELRLREDSRITFRNGLFFARLIFMWHLWMTLQSVFLDWFLDVLPSPCWNFHNRIMSICNEIPPEGPKITASSSDFQPWDFSNLWIFENMTLGGVQSAHILHDQQNCEIVSQVVDVVQICKPLLIFTSERRCLFNMFFFHIYLIIPLTCC